MFSLASEIDFDDVRSDLDQHGRCRVSGLLAPEGLKPLREAIEQVPNWVLVTLIEGQHRDLDAAAMAAMPAEKQIAFKQYVQARRGFQYLYETYPLYDEWHAQRLQQSVPILARLFEWLNGDEFLDAMRSLFDEPEIGFADAQLTRYRGGHFLSTHDDNVRGKNRVAAYVLSLSAEWQADWGGALEFTNEAGRTLDRFVPSPNTLALFRVPQPHAVQPVADGAPRARLSITGWLRRGKDPGP